VAFLPLKGEPLRLNEGSWIAIIPSRSELLLARPGELLQELPLHELPLHELTDQLEPFQELPDQESWLQLELLQEWPLRELADQVEPFQAPPDQLSAARPRERPSRPS
jgi:hypothetical protein